MVTLSRSCSNSDYPADCEFYGIFFSHSILNNSQSGSAVRLPQEVRHDAGFEAGEGGDNVNLSMAARSGLSRSTYSKRTELYCFAIILNN